MNKIDVTAFVDWNSQLFNTGAKSLKNAKDRAKLTLDKTVTAIANSLRSIDSKTRFDVRLRLYHGWYRGLEATENKKGLIEVEGALDFEVGTHKNVRFSAPLEFGDHLLSALPHRCRVQKPTVHLPNTLRPDRENPNIEREKMVDTALACDLLTHARYDPKDWRIVLAEDDDLVPAVYASEAWTKDKGGKTFLIRKRNDSKHLNLNGLTLEYKND